jgi:predicted DCC family thiol-disulfide oxidoreductase YuxK
VRPLRILTEPWNAFVGLLRAGSSGWNTFFFTPADPTPVGLIRLIVGSLACWSLFVYGWDLKAFLGPNGWANASVVREYWAERVPGAWSIWFLVPDAALRAVWAVEVAVAALCALGVASRATTPLTWVFVTSTARRAPFSLYGFDQILSTWLLYLAVTDASGQALSIDRWIGRARRFRSELFVRPKGGKWTPTPGIPEPSIRANLCLRLIQCHLVVIYAMAGLAKLQGRAWWEGTAIWGTLAAGEFRRFDLTWLAAYPLLLNALTHFALALELVYPVLIWNRRLRPWLIGAMVMLHLGIDVTLGLTEFGLVMIAGNLAFTSGAWLRSLVIGDAPAPGRVLYDGVCPRCRASIALICAGDPARLIEPLDLNAVEVATIHPSLTKERCVESMHLVHASGRVESGFDAVVRIASWTPTLALPALVRFVPGVSRLGRVAYNRIALSRPREVCNDDVCDAPNRPSSRAPR